MPDVPGVELEALRPRDRVAPVHLRPPGDAGLHGQAPPVGLGVVRNLLDDVGARPDEAHLPAHDVEQLRELVEARAPQKAAAARDARIIRQMPVRILADLQRLTDRDCVLHHRPELVHAEYTAALADAGMGEEHRPACLEQDPERDRREQRAEEDERDGRKHAVERVLDAGGRRVPGKIAHGRIIAAVRVAIVDPASTTPPYDHSLASALARRGHNVDLLTSPFPFGPVPAPVGYRRDELFLPVSGRILARNPRSRSRYVVKGLEYLPSVRRLSRRLHELEPDVVHVQWLALPRLDVRWLRRVAADTPTVFTAHHALPRDAGAGLDARRRIYDVVQRVIVHSRRAVDELAALGVERERIAYIPHAVFESEARDEPSPPTGSTLLFFGLLRAYKGIDVLVRALAHIPDARLIVAGDPLDPVEPLQELARDLGVAGRIEWRLGFLPVGQVRGLMADAAAVVVPYRRLDSSGVLATAIGYRRPVVVTDVGSLGEMVRAYTSITRRSGSLKLLNLTAKVHDLLAMTGLLSVFDCADTELKALESFGNT